MRKGWGLLSVTPELLTSELLSQLRFNSDTTLQKYKDFPKYSCYFLVFCEFLPRRDLSRFIKRSVDHIK